MLCACVMYVYAMIRYHTVTAVNANTNHMTSPGIYKGPLCAHYSMYVYMYA